MGANGPEENAKTEGGQLKKFLSTLSSSGLTILGGTYVIGYIIVNGYQTKTMFYSSSALQLKHITAGALYALLTLSEVSIMAWSVASALTTWQDWRDEHKKGEGKPQPDAEPQSPKLRAALSRWYSDSATLAFLRIWGQAILVAGGAIGALFGIIGIATPSGSLGPKSGLVAFSEWTGINFLASLIVAGSVRAGYAQTFDEALKSEAKPEDAESQANSDPQTAEDFNRALRAGRRRFIDRGIERVLAPVGLAFCALLSLVSFQGVYGRLKPDYGGGALYRVKAFVASEKLPKDILESLQAQDARLLLVDRDDKFVHLLRVDKSGNKRLFQIEASELAAVEVLPDAPIHPDDVAGLLGQK